MPFFSLFCSRKSDFFEFLMCFVSKKTVFFHSCEKFSHIFYTDYQWCYKENEKNLKKYFVRMEKGCTFAAVFDRKTEKFEMMRR